MAKTYLSSISRTTQFLRKQGDWEFEITQHWNPQAKKRRDLFKWIDILALHELHGTVGIQASYEGSVSTRLDVVVGSRALRLAIENNWRLWLWFWEKKGKADDRKVWTPRVLEVECANDFMTYSMEPRFPFKEKKS